MASCMVGSSSFDLLAQRLSLERVLAGMLATASGALAAASRLSSIGTTLASFYIFEACVGIYFPAIGTLRSKYIPDSHRGVIMSMIRVPLNIFVVAVMLGLKRLGLQGSLICSSAAI